MGHGIARTLLPSSGAPDSHGGRRGVRAGLGTRMRDSRQESQRHFPALSCTFTCLGARLTSAWCRIGLMRQERQPLSADPQPPAAMAGFGDRLLWLLMTRAPEVVYDLYENGPANRMREYFLPGDQECLPTQAAVAWLILAGELGVAPGNLPRSDQEVKNRHRRLRGQLYDLLNEQSRGFKDEWIHSLGASARQR